MRFCKEYYLIKALCNLSYFYARPNDRTYLIATHKVQDWPRCDRVIHLEKGKMSFNGNFNEYLDWKAKNDSLIA